jgi:uncharacterized protein with NRDE domain
VCILLALRAGGDLWVAANRDERLDRPWAPPRLLVTDPPVLGGQDLESGGSWLALNLEGRFVAGVTNARLGAKPGERSRGQLVLDVASQRTLADAVAVVAELDLTRYGKFNLLMASVDAVWLASNEPEARLQGSEDTVVAIGNELLEGVSERTREARRSLLELPKLEDEARIAALVHLLASHGGRDPLCRHHGRFGTSSSTILGLEHGRVVTYLFAAGPPCTTPYAPVTIPA